MPGLGLPYFKRRWVTALVAGLLLLIWLTNRQPPLTPVSIAARSTTRPFSWIPCITPTPRRWNGEGFIDAFAAMEKIGPTVCLPDPVDYWRACGKQATDSKPFRDHRWQDVLLKRHHLDVFIQMDPYSTRRGPIPNLPKQVKADSFFDPVLREAFIADAKQRVELYRPRFLCLAMEINSYYEQHPGDFDHFVTLFKEARKIVKQVDPKVLVFVSFQYEQLLGIFGGQAGLPRHEPQWELFQMFGPDIDAIGISSYPMTSLDPPRFGPPEAMPADYYLRIAQHTKKPIVFAELGWASNNKFGGSPENQAAFLGRLPKLLKGLDVQLVNYNFLFDAKGFGEVFESMGLIGADGKVKPALDVWLSL